MAIISPSRPRRPSAAVGSPDGLPDVATAPRRRAPAVARLWDGVVKVAAMATTPLVPTDYLELLDPLRLGADLRGRLVSRTPETADAASLVIRPGRGWRPHVPGQYVRVGVDVDGVRHWRAYSLTSHVEADDGCIAITVKKIPGGVVSAYLVDHIRPGALLMLDQATGDFVMPPVLPAKVLFLTAGSGITPVMGILRNRRTPELAALDVVLVHSAPSGADVVFGPELRAMAETGEIRFVEQHTDADGMLDFADPATLDRLVPDWRDRGTWACGPAPLLDACQELWAAEGLEDSLHTERFRPKVAAIGEGGTVTFAGSGVVVEADGGTPLLDAGEEAGVLMPSGCRMGICFGCTAPLLEGSVRDLRSGEVTTVLGGDEHEVIAVQTCINAAAGSCRIDL